LLNCMAEGSGWRAKSGREAALYSRYRSTNFGFGLPILD
jgi:hypothetical protein